MPARRRLRHERVQPLPVDVDLGERVARKLVHRFLEVGVVRERRVALERPADRGLAVGERVPAVDLAVDRAVAGRVLRVQLRDERLELGGVVGLRQRDGLRRRLVAGAHDRDVELGAERRLHVRVVVDALRGDASASAAADQVVAARELLRELVELLPLIRRRCRCRPRRRRATPARTTLAPAGIEPPLLLVFGALPQPARSAARARNGRRRRMVTPGLAGGPSILQLTRSNPARQERGRRPR